MLTFYSLMSFAQPDSMQIPNKNFYFVSANYHSGTVIPTNEFLEGDNLKGEPIDIFQSGTIKIGIQNPGYTDWQKVYNSPYYGLGYYMADFHTEELGTPMAVFGFFGFPIKRWSKVEIVSEFQFGMAWHWNDFDEETNPKNIAIGGPITVHLDIGVLAYYNLTKHIDLGVGFSFAHFSNGGFERPQRGVNVYAPFLELKYNISGRPDIRNIAKPGRLQRSNDLYLMLGYGDHQLPEFEYGGEYYAVAGIGAYYLMQHSNVLKTGLGVDTNFMWGLSPLPNGMQGPPGWKNLTIGFIYQQEYVIGDLSLVSGIGIYARHKEYGNYKQMYQRLGAKYHITDNISAGVNIRAIDFIGAEFFEFNMGYRFRWMK